MSTKRFIIFTFLCLAWVAARCQIFSSPVFIVVDSLSTDTVKQIDKQAVLKAYDESSYFGLYKDNYFIVGCPLNTTPTAANSNVKFQISVQQRITKSVLPFGTYLYLFYTQKVFWNVFEESMPMTDLNFNPGIGLTKPLFVHNKYIGKVKLIVEHESNGRDGEASRSWNRVSFAANIMIDPNVMVHGKVWIPIIDSDNNRDICKYCGIFQTGLQVMSNDRRFNGSLTLVKRGSLDLRYNLIAELGVRMWKRANEFFFVQLYRGYGEGLLDYNKYHCQLRVGVQIKPTFFSDF